MMKKEAKRVVPRDRNVRARADKLMRGRADI
jgi:hypothetical protein